MSVKWSRASATGRPPTKRSGHSAIALGRYLVITGGANGNRYLPVEELHLLHTSRLVWSTLRPLENNISPVLTPGPLSPFWFPSQPWLPKSRTGSFPSTENACTDTVEAGKEISIGKWSKVEVEGGDGGGGMIQRLDGDAQTVRLMVVGLEEAKIMLLHTVPWLPGYVQLWQQLRMAMCCLCLGAGLLSIPWVRGRN